LFYSEVQLAVPVMMNVDSAVVDTRGNPHTDYWHYSMSPIAQILT